MTIMKYFSILLAAAVGVCATLAVTVSRPEMDLNVDVDWPVYRGDPKANQYAPLAQIHAANVHKH